jgi:hypothetical protein
MHAVVHGVDIAATRRSLGAAVFAIGLAAIAAQNFIASDFVTELQPVPASIPGRTLLAYLNGALLLAATAGAPRFRRIAHVAASLWALMTGLWVVLLHVPRALAHMDTRPEWTSLFVAITLCGGGLLVRQTLARGGRR